MTFANKLSELYERCHIIDNDLAARRLLIELGTATTVGLDTETTGCDPTKEGPVGRAKIWCMTLCYQTPEGLRAAFVSAPFVEYYRDWLESDHSKVGHNIYGYDRHVFSNCGITLRGICGDTLGMSRLLDPSKTFGHGLKTWGTRLGYTTQDYAQVASRRVPGSQRVYKRDRTVEKDGVITHYTAGAESVNLLKKTELLDFEILWRDYPHRRQSIVEYAVQDAVLHLDLFYHLSFALAERPW